MTEKKRKDVGYGRPPKEHQFSAGRSGNPAGRRRTPRRNIEPRQNYLDVLNVTESPTSIQTPDGRTITVPTVVAVLMVARKKALSGHGPSMRMLLDRHVAALVAYWDLDSFRDDFPEHDLHNMSRLRERFFDAEAIRENANKRRRRR